MLPSVTVAATASEAESPQSRGRCQDAVMTSATDAVDHALARIAAHDGELRSVCTVNPRAATTAATLDDERAAGRVRGPLHGRPVLVKDNVDTADLLTTAGSLALAARPPSQDAELVRRLR